MKVTLIFVAFFVVLVQLFFFDILSIVWWLIPSVINLSLALFAYLKLESKFGALLAGLGAFFISFILAFNVFLPSTIDVIKQHLWYQNQAIDKPSFVIERGAKINLVSDLSEITFRVEEVDWPRYRSDLSPWFRIHGSAKRGYRYQWIMVDDFARQLELIKFELVPIDGADYVLNIAQLSDENPNYLQISLLKGDDVIAEELIYRSRTTVESARQDRSSRAHLLYLEYLMSNTFWHHLVRYKFDKSRGSIVRDFFDGRVKVVKPPVIIMGTEPFSSDLP